MSEHENGKAECPFSATGEELVNVKFFRGRRNDIISAEEFNEQVRSARMQLRLQTADVSKTAPVSSHPVIDVREFVAAL
jgi:hypothetical protein